MAEPLPLTVATPRLIPRAWGRGHKSRPCSACRRIAFAPPFACRRVGSIGPSSMRDVRVMRGRNEVPWQARWGASLTVALPRMQDPGTILPELTSTPTLVYTLAFLHPPA